MSLELGLVIVWFVHSWGMMFWDVIYTQNHGHNLGLSKLTKFIALCGIFASMGALVWLIMYPILKILGLI